MPKTLADLLADAKSRIVEVDVAGARRWMDEHPEGLVLDVREAEEVAGGRISGAVHVPRGVLEPKAAPDSPAHDAVFGDPDRPILVYCGTGARSALAADVLRELGFSKVCSLAGGIGAWRMAGQPTR